MRYRAAAVILAALAVTPAFAHPKVNGTWVLVPEQSTFRGMPAITTGTVTIQDREHNIFISRHLAVNSEDAAEEYNYTTDAREHSTIRQGKDVKIKVWWDGDALKARTQQGDQVRLEEYRLSPDGNNLLLTIESADHQLSSLAFRRQ